MPKVPATAHAGATLLPVILCGGSGTRLWPLSRSDHPKQFLPLAPSGATLLQETLRRLDRLDASIPRAAPLLVCNAAHRFIAAQQVQDAGVTDARIVLEPAGRNTAPALTLAALLAPAGAVLLAMPADHAIRDCGAFLAAVAHAWPQALDGAMVTFGVVPERAETGYGYIRTGAPTGATLAVRAFTEKPDAATAQRYLSAGGYLWNSGLFLISATRWLHAMETLQPSMLAACRRAADGARHDLDFIRPDAEAFSACPADSIDYAVMERLPQQPELGIPVRVVPLDAGWSDLGTWEALWHELAHDAAGNATHGTALALDTRGSLLYAASRTVVAVGVRDLVIAETPDAVLVASRSATQRVKAAVAQLAQRAPATVAAPRKVHRPWGWYDAIDRGARFQVKRLLVRPGAAISLQRHQHRAEHWVVVRGRARVTRGAETLTLRANESIFIPIGCRHRLANPGPEPLEVIEVQSGDYLGEDDIERFEDRYGRAPASGKAPAS